MIIPTEIENDFINTEGKDINTTIKKIIFEQNNIFIDYYNTVSGYNTIKYIKIKNKWKKFM